MHEKGCKILSWCKKRTKKSKMVEQKRNDTIFSSNDCFYFDIFDFLWRIGFNFSGNKDGGEIVCKRNGM